MATSFLYQVVWLKVDRKKQEITYLCFIKGILFCWDCWRLRSRYYSWIWKSSGLRSLAVERMIARLVGEAQPFSTGWTCLSPPTPNFQTLVKHVPRLECNLWRGGIFKGRLGKKCFLSYNPLSSHFSSFILLRTEPLRIMGSKKSWITKILKEWSLGALVVKGASLLAPPAHPRNSWHHLLVSDALKKDNDWKPTEILGSYHQKNLS